MFVSCSFFFFFFVPYNKYCKNWLIFSPICLLCQLCQNNGDKLKRLPGTFSKLFESYSPFQMAQLCYFDIDLATLTMETSQMIKRFVFAYNWHYSKWPTGNSFCVASGHYNQPSKLARDTGWLLSIYKGWLAGIFFCSVTCCFFFLYRPSFNLVLTLNFNVIKQQRLCHYKKGLFLLTIKTSI